MLSIHLVDWREVVNILRIDFLSLVTEYYTDAEILDMLVKVKAENKLPRIYLTCGKDDAFMKEHELFTGALDKMGIPYEFDKLEGAHEFQCFNEALKRAIARFEGR